MLGPNSGILMILAHAGRPYVAFSFRNLKASDKYRLAAIALVFGNKFPNAGKHLLEVSREIAQGLTFGSAKSCL